MTVLRVTRLRHTEWLVPFGAAACYALFALAVHLRLFDALDLAVRQAARPADVWGPVQARANRVVGLLQPAHFAWSLLLVVAGLSLALRSLRPLGAATAVGLPAVIVTLASKWVMTNSDRTTTPVSHGSFPSGHTVCATVVCGLVVLLYRPRTRWGWALPVLTGALIGSALLLAGVHPVTDVIGAGLLAVAVLATAEAAGVEQWTHRFHEEGGR